MARFLVLAGAIAIVLLFLQLVVVNKLSDPGPKYTPFPTQRSPDPTPIGVPTPRPTPNTKVYSSPKLGIAFNYQPAYGTDPNPDDSVFVEEKGNKIYIYATSADLNTGEVYRLTDQHVEVFAKNPQDTPEEAIRKLFLTGSYADNCVVNLQKGELRGQHYSNDYKYLYISAKKYKDIPIGPEVYSEISQLCPSEYTNIGFRYFLADDKHPAKLLFFQLGHDVFNSGLYIENDSAYREDHNPPWDATIRFL